MDKIEEIDKAFKDIGLFVDIYTIDENEILVCISWRNKYEHIACKQVMRRLGYEHVQEVITEDNGSGCYSSEHTFRIDI